MSTWRPTIKLLQVDSLDLSSDAWHFICSHQFNLNHSPESNPHRLMLVFWFSSSNQCVRKITETINRRINRKKINVNLSLMGKTYPIRTRLKLISSERKRGLEGKRRHLEDTGWIYHHRWTSNVIPILPPSKMRRRDAWPERIAAWLRWSERMKRMSGFKYKSELNFTATFFVLLPAF